MYELLFSPAAERYFKKLKDKRLLAKFKESLLRIQEDPFVGQVKHGDLSGIYGYDVYYDKTNYEIAYSVFEIDGKKVVVLLAGTRQNFYEELKRLTKSWYHELKDPEAIKLWDLFIPHDIILHPENIPKRTAADILQIIQLRRYQKYDVLLSVNQLQ